jgi:6,7-dimethyl-8-ribityllumazine synthase
MNMTVRRESPQTERPDGTGLHVAIIATRWHRDIVDKMLKDARETLNECSVEDIHEVRCEGAFELPVIASNLAHLSDVDAVICLGVVIRGETPHFDFVAGPVAHALQQVAISTGVPCIFGVLTTDTVDQALERAGGAHGNKGIDAAIAAVDTALTIRSIS